MADPPILRDTPDPPRDLRPDLRPDLRSMNTGTSASTRKRLSTAFAALGKRLVVSVENAAITRALQPIGALGANTEPPRRIGIEVPWSPNTTLCDSARRL